MKVNLEKLRQFESALTSSGVELSEDSKVLSVDITFNDSPEDL